MSAVGTNMLLDALPLRDRSEVLALSRSVSLPLRTSLQSAEQPPPYAYFLTSGVASVVVALSDGGSAETILIGCEGITGAFSLLGSAAPPAE